MYKNKDFYGCESSDFLLKCHIVDKKYPLLYS